MRKRQEKKINRRFMQKHRLKRLKIALRKRLKQLEPYLKDMRPVYEFYDKVGCLSFNDNHIGASFPVPQIKGEEK